MLLALGNWEVDASWPGGQNHRCRRGRSGLDSRPVESDSRQQLAAAMMFLQSCVVQTLSHGDGPRRSLLASG